MVKKNDIKEINYIKGVAIILVFIGHAATPSFLQRPYYYEFIVQAIYSMHMSLFFLVSGFLSLKVNNMNLRKDYLLFIKNKFYRLGIPFLTVSFFTNLIIIIFKLLFNQQMNKSELLYMIKIIFLYPENGIMGALWFIYTLMMINILAPFIMKLPFKLVILVLLAFNIFIPKYINFLSFSRTSFFLIYFFIGLYFRVYYEENRKDVFENISKLKKIIIASVSIGCIFLYSYIVTNGVFISIYILNILNFLCGLFGIALILISIRKFKNNKIYNDIVYLGQYSIDIYIFSWFFQVVSMIVTTKILKISNYNIFFMSNIIVGSISLPFSLYIIRKFKILKLLFLGDFKK